MHIDFAKFLVGRFPSRFRNIRFSDFEADDRHLLLLKNFADAHVAGSCPDGLFLMGPSCTGKTYRMAAVCRDIITRHKEVTWVNAYDFQDNCANGIVDPNSEQTWLYSGRNDGILAIDGLGRERCAKWDTNFVAQTITWRRENDKPTFVTTGLWESDLHAIYGEDFLLGISSRMLVIGLTKQWGLNDGALLTKKYGG